MDLFENYNLLEGEALKIFNEMNTIENERGGERSLNFNELENFKNKFEDVGYTFEYDIDGSYYNLIKL